MVDVSKLSLYTIVKQPLEVSKLSLLVPQATPLYVGKLSMYAVVAGTGTRINALFNFDYKIQISPDLEFDWRINAKVSRTFDFNWAINSSYFNHDFNFDYKIKLYVDFDFDYSIEDQPPPGPVLAHSYWRVYYLSQSGANIQYSEVVFFDTAGTDVTTGGSAVFSTQANGTTLAAANAFDKNNTTNYSATGNKKQWIGYHFAAPVEIKKLGLRASTVAPAQSSTVFVVDWSDDGTNWTHDTYVEDTAGVMTSLAYREYNVTHQTLLFDDNPHRYWRINIGVQGEGGFAGVVEFDLMDNGSSVNDAHSSTKSARQSNGSFPIANAFDGNSATVWFTGANLHIINYATLDFGSGNAYSVDGLRAQAQTGTDIQYMPQTFFVQYSDDNSTWTYRGDTGLPVTYTTGETKTFSFGGPPSPTDIYRDLDFNWKIAHNVSKTFDWRVFRTTTADFDFDWGIEGFNANLAFDWKIRLRADFDFDWQIPLFATFDFDWLIDGEWRNEFDFDWRIRLHAEYDFNWKIQLGSTKTFDYRIGEVGNVTAAYVQRFPEVPITETWQYSTIYNTSENNTERRACLREWPRVQLSHMYVIEDNTDYRLFRGYMFAQRYTNFYIAQHSQAVFLTTAAAYGEIVINVDLANADVRVNDYVGFYNIGTEETTLALVTAVDTDTIEIDGGLNYAVGPGWVLLPVRLMRFADNSVVSMGTIAGSLAASFEDATVRSIVRSGAEPDLVTLFEGRPILTFRPELDAARDNAFLTGRRMIDNAADMAALAVKYWDVPEETLTYMTMIERGASLDYWREFADIVRGNWKAFFLPTFRPDLLPVTFAGANLTVAGNHIDDLVGSGGYKQLMITTDTGAQFFTVDAAISAGDNTLLVLDGGIDGETISEISFINRVRITDDLFTFEHSETHTKLRLNLKVVRA